MTQRLSMHVAYMSINLELCHPYELNPLTMNFPSLPLIVPFPLKSTLFAFNVVTSISFGLGFSLCVYIFFPFPYIYFIF